jgi:NTE family protein
MSRKRVGLALGGGGARGLAHVGVLRVLEREGIPIDCIAGTSAGSVVGAAYAAGMRADRLLDFAQRLRWRQVGRLVWPRLGFVSFDRLEAYLVDVFGDVTFASLKLRYAAVAADLATGEAVILRRGRVASAVRASCSVPGIVTPLDLDGRLLVDGGVANNLPISVARALGAEVVIAVGLVTPSQDNARTPLRIGFKALEVLIAGAGDDPATADVYLSIPLTGLGSLLRTSAWQPFVALGEQVAERALPLIRAALG